MSVTTSTNVLSKTHKQDLLMKSLQLFYRQPDNIKTILEILEKYTLPKVRRSERLSTEKNKKRHTLNPFLNIY